MVLVVFIYSCSYNENLEAKFYRWIFLGKIKVDPMSEFSNKNIFDIMQ